MGKKFFKLMKKILPKETQQTPRRISTLKHNIVKLLKIKDKEKILTALKERGERLHTREYILTSHQKQCKLQINRSFT